MNYVVVVLEPVPQDLGVVAQSVSERFKISSEKALALLQRAPGAVTKAVPEQQAKTVAEILSEAGLLVEVREGSAVGPPLPLFAAAAAGSLWSTGSGAAPAPDHDSEQELGADHDAATDDAVGRHDTYGGQAAAAEDSHRPLGAVTVGADDPYDDVHAEGYAVVDDFDDEHVAAGSVDMRAATTTVGGTRRDVPEAGHATSTPPRDPMKTTLTRNPPD